MVKEGPWVIARRTTLFRRKKTNGIPQASEEVELEISAQKKAKTRTTKRQLLITGQTKHYAGCMKGNVIGLVHDSIMKIIINIHKRFI